MKEIMAIIRQSMMKQTLAALSEIGVDSVTVHSVNGRGRQGGNIMESVDPEMKMNVESVSKIYKYPTPSSLAGLSKLTKPVFWIPKNLLNIVISEVPLGAFLSGGAAAPTRLLLRNDMTLSGVTRRADARLEPRR